MDLAFAHSALKTKNERSSRSPRDPVLGDTRIPDREIRRKSSCACGGGCPSCQSGAGSLKISQPNDAAEIEADAIADRVMRMPVADDKPVHSNSRISESQIQRQPDGETPAAGEEPDPIGEGLATVAENLDENNPAFSELTEDLGNRFRALPTPLSVGVPLFLGANYLGIWTLAMLNPAMRRHLNDFDLGMLPGALVPEFPIKSFTYRILDPEQTRFEFDVGLDASGIIESIDENSPLSTLSVETAGRLNTDAPTGTPPIGLSSLNVNLGLFDDGLMFSGGFRQGVDPYPLLHRDPYTGEGSRIMQQVPGLPDLYPGQQDIRFMLQVDFVKLYNYFNPQSTPIRSVPQQLEGDRIDRQIQRKYDASEELISTSGSASADIYLASLSGGETLCGNEKQFFESRFGHDFSNVRLHTNSRANESANNVNAVAYTHGNNIVFGRDQYQPGTESGKRLLAHELTHVMQQGKGLSPQLQRYPNGCVGTECLHEELVEQYAGPDAPPGTQYSRGYADWITGGGTPTPTPVQTPTPTPTPATPCPTSVSIGTLLPFNHSNLSTTDKDNYRTYLGVTSQMNVGPGPDHSRHCMKERLTTVSNSCPASVYTRGGTVVEPCTGNRCLDINTSSSLGDGPTHSMVSDGPTSFVDLHRTRNTESFLDGSGVNSCSVVCEQVYTCDRTHATTGRFLITRNYVAGTHTRADGTAVSITTGTVTKTDAP